MDTPGSRGIEQRQSITQPDHAGNGRILVPGDMALEQTEGQLTGLQRTIDKQRQISVLRQPQ